MVSVIPLAIRVGGYSRSDPGRRAEAGARQEKEWRRGNSMDIKFLRF
jgi:hypothetical protein